MQKLRARVPGIAVRSTFIAGFPTETEEEVHALADFLREQKLENCGFFAYSREPDTPAYKLKGQIPAREKQKRVKMLYRVQREIAAAQSQEKVGTTIDVLCDGVCDDGSCFEGRAYWQAPEADGKVYFTASHGVQGEMYRVKITDADEYNLFGEAEETES